MDDAADPDERGARRSGRRSWRGCLVVVLVAVALGLGYVGLMAYALHSATSPERDPDNYVGVVRERKSRSPEQYAFLPDDIDPSAEKVAFYHLPGFLQGGDVICLRLRLSPQRVAEVLRGIETAGRRELAPFREFGAPHCYPAFTDDTARGEDGHGNPAPLPAGFRIFNVGATPEEIAAEWNHNFQAFIAVSTERSEVIWYADRW